MKPFDCANTLGVLVLAVASVRAQVPPGWTLSYRGEVARLTADGTGPVEKNFDLWLMAAPTNEAGQPWYWMFEESGRGQATWRERYGAWKLHGDTTADDSGPALYYERDDHPARIKLPAPTLVVEGELADDHRWSRDKWKFQVEAEERLEGRDTWRILVSNEYGRKRIVWLEKQGRLVVGINERVFMGQGEEYQLRMRLVGATKLSDEEAAKHAADAQLLTELRDKLGPAADRTALNEKERNLLRELLPVIEPVVARPPYSKIVRAAREDLVSQSDRAGRIESLVGKFQGAPVEKFELRGARGEALSDADLQGRVTVLHFWDYRDQPLREPYGQVGYLDFLSEKRKPDGVKVYGIAVDGRFGDEARRAGAIRSVTRLISFMNLSYPVLLDDGRVLKQFGDPRTVGGQLPLFVVIGADGKIAHYFVGCYEVDRDAGLKVLDGVLDDALKKPAS